MSNTVPDAGNGTNRGILKTGDIRHFGDNFPSVITQTGAGVLPNASNTGEAVAASDFAGQYLSDSGDEGTVFRAGDSTQSADFTTKGNQPGNMLAGGNTIGGGDAANEGFDSFSSKRG